MLTESAIEAFAIKLLERLGYVYLHGPSIAPDGDSPQRATYADVLLLERLTQAARMELLATQTVLKQAQMIASELTQSFQES